MSDIAIRVENLGKLYRVGEFVGYRTIRESLMNAFSVPFHRFRHSVTPGTGVQNRDSEYIWALKDVSFTVNRGEAIGIIGRNGAGKTTLLKVLTRITEPTEGYAEVHGRVGSLLEVGSGFHPELTGRENIYLNGAVLGMKKKEIDRKFDEIVEFAGVAKFIDTPLKRYSSGMQVRLAFSVAAHLEPEILLVDEVLAVGDAEFQKKCLGKMEDVAKGGRTVLFVSHNMAAITSLCSRAIVLDSGRLVIDTDVSSAVGFYIKTTTDLVKNPIGERQDRTGSGLIQVVGLEVLDEGGKPTDTVICGKRMGIRAHLHANSDVSSLKNVAVGFAVNGLLQGNMFVLGTDVTGQNFDMTAQDFFVECWLERVPLLGGEYFFNSYVTVRGEIADWVLDAGRFSVITGDFFGSGKLTPSTHSHFLVHHKWTTYEGK